jgi:hypothetical protein
MNLSKREKHIIWSTIRNEFFASEMCGRMEQVTDLVPILEKIGDKGCNLSLEESSDGKESSTEVSDGVARPS